MNFKKILFNLLYKIGVINDVKNVYLQIKESIEK